MFLKSSETPAKFLTEIQGFMVFLFWQLTIFVRITFTPVIKQFYRGKDAPKVKNKNSSSTHLIRVSVHCAYVWVSGINTDGSPNIYGKRALRTLCMMQIMFNISIYLILMMLLLLNAKYLYAHCKSSLTNLCKVYLHFILICFMCYNNTYEYSLDPKNHHNNCTKS